jgi:hypothetical protein
MLSLGVPGRRETVMTLVTKVVGSALGGSFPLVDTMVRDGVKVADTAEDQIDSFEA